MRRRGLVVGRRDMSEDKDYVWVVRGHDQYEGASYTESVWTEEAAAVAHVDSRWPFEIDRVRINTPEGYD